MRARQRLASDLRRVQRSDADLVPRVILEIAAGYAAGALGVLVGYVLGALVSCSSTAVYADWACAGGTAAFIAVWSGTFTAAAESGVHEALGGMGNAYAGVGGLGGMAGFMALDLLIASAIPDPAAATDFGAVFLMALIPVLTTTIACELADDGEADAIRRTASVLPGATLLTDQGRVVGAQAGLRLVVP
jgi:hypothetical protein